MRRRPPIDSRTLVRAIFDLSASESGAFWTGNPHPETARLYLERLGFSEREQLFRLLHDDCRWVMAENGYRHPAGRPMFSVPAPEERITLSQPGPLADCNSLREVDGYPWPDPDHFDFSDVLAEIRSHADKAVFTGMWSPFFHIVADLFGMENYFVRMHTDPHIVEAVTARVVDFCCEANRRFFTALGGEADVFFFGNDFGTQLDLLVSPDDFRRFVLPGFRRLIDGAKSFGKKVLLHSCGSVYKVIPMLIDAGIDGLHPLQARAADMNAEKLAREFGAHIAFVGGVDTQQLLIHGAPVDVREEVRRLRDVFGPNFIVSPSHEAILPNVPLDNIVAMAEAARE